jgi:hypothetical protein
MSFDVLWTPRRPLISHNISVATAKSTAHICTYERWFAATVGGLDTTTRAVARLT